MPYYNGKRPVTPWNSGSGKEDFLANWFAGQEKARDTGKTVMAADWQGPKADSMPTPEKHLPPRPAAAPDATNGVLDGQIRAFQQQHGLKVDGIINPNGETANRINHIEAGQMMARGENPAGPLMDDIDASAHDVFPRHKLANSAMNRAGADTWRYAMAAYKAAKIFGQKEADKMRHMLAGDPQDPAAGAIDALMRQGAALAADPDNMRRDDDEVIREAMMTGALIRLDARYDSLRQQQGFDARTALRRALSFDDLPWSSRQDTGDRPHSAEQPPANNTSAKAAMMDDIFARHNAALLSDTV